MTLTIKRTTKRRPSHKSRHTLVSTLEKRYGVKLGYPSDRKVSTILRETGLPSLARLLDMADATKR